MKVGLGHRRKKLLFQWAEMMEVSSVSSFQQSIDISRNKEPTAEVSRILLSLMANLLD